MLKNIISFQQANKLHRVIAFKSLVNFPCRRFEAPEDDEAQLRELRNQEIRKERLRKSPGWNESDDLTKIPVFHINDFLTNQQEELSDEVALKYLNYAAKSSMLSFKDDEELLSYKNDFNQALSFINKIEEVDVKGVEPLGSVLEIYGGNFQKMRTAAGYLRANDDQISDDTMQPKYDYFKEIQKLNKHMKASGYVEFNRSTKFNPDEE